MLKVLTSTGSVGLITMRWVAVVTYQGEVGSNELLLRQPQKTGFDRRESLW
jgi:hypothetical protein